MGHWDTCTNTSPVIISNDDDLVAVSELFARADPAPAAVAATAIPAAGTHNLGDCALGMSAQIGLRLPPRRRRNKRLRGVPRRPRRQIQAQALA